MEVLKIIPQKPLHHTNEERVGAHPYSETTPLNESSMCLCVESVDILVPQINSTIVAVVQNVPPERVAES